MSNSIPLALNTQETTISLAPGEAISLLFHTPPLSWRHELIYGHTPHHKSQSPNTHTQNATQNASFVGSASITFDEFYEASTSTGCAQISVQGMDTTLATIKIRPSTSKQEMADTPHVISNNSNNQATLDRVRSCIVVLAAASYIAWGCGLISPPPPTLTSTPIPIPNPNNDTDTCDFQIYWEAKQQPANLALLADTQNTINSLLHAFGSILFSIYFLQKFVSRKSFIGPPMSFSVSLVGFCRVPTFADFDSSSSGSDNENEEAAAVREFGSLVNEVPERFIAGCEGDEVEAKKRWIKTLRWRKSDKIDTILEEPSEFFHIIKKYFPHYYCGRSKQGNMMYWEQCGEINPKKLKENGATVDIMVRHYIMMTEFCWTNLVPQKDSKTVTVFDVSGVGLGDLKGDTLSFVKKSTALMQDHYPERAQIVVIVNAPSWFSFLYALLQPLINERTQKKVKIYSKSGSLRGLLEIADIEMIPKRLGGKMDEGLMVEVGELCGGDGGFGQKEYDGNAVRWFSKDEVTFRNHIRKVNEKLQCRNIL